MKSYKMFSPVIFACCFTSLVHAAMLQEQKQEEQKSCEVEETQAFDRDGASDADKYMIMELLGKNLSGDTDDQSFDATLRFFDLFGQLAENRKTFARAAKNLRAIRKESAEEVAAAEEEYNEQYEQLCKEYEENKARILHDFENRKAEIERRHAGDIKAVKEELCRGLKGANILIKELVKEAVALRSEHDNQKSLTRSVPSQAAEDDEDDSDDEDDQPGCWRRFVNFICCRCKSEHEHKE